MKILVDMNLSPRWLETLRHAGFQAEHWASIGELHAPDIDIFTYAKLNHYVILTQDLDFGDLLAVDRGTRPSVVIIRSVGLRPETIGTQVIEALRQAEAELLNGAMAVIDPARLRVRTLPL
jgi:predicted nuclease of predicted toxin-antitoxin system